MDLDQFASYLAAHPQDRFLFVDDGSTDDTAERILAFSNRFPQSAQLLRLPENFGKAEAVRLGIRAAAEHETDSVAFLDADLATPLHCIPELREALEYESKLQIVLGSRVRLLGLDIRRNPVRHVLGRVFATTAVLMLGVSVYDTQCGAKLFRKNPLTHGLFDRPFLSRWLFDIEILIRFVNAANVSRDQIGAMVKEVPVSTWHDVPGSKVGFSGWVRSLLDLGRIWWKEIRPLRSRL
jgi:glycosyltransferase involved in cell wall biosynthesis